MLKFKVMYTAIPSMKYLIYSCFFFLIGCQKKDPLLNDLEKRFNVSINENIDRIYFIDENTITCLPCTIAYSKYINAIGEDNNNLYLFNNSNNLLEINNLNNPYVIYEKNKVIYDSLKMGIIYLSRGKIDSIKNITPLNMESILKKDVLD